jgi:hypothetical protein
MTPEHDLRGGFAGISVQNVLTKLFQSLHFALFLLMVTMILLAWGTTVYSKGGGGHGGGHSSGHAAGHAGSGTAHSAHHSEHHEGHGGDKHGHFRQFHAIHHGFFGGGGYCLTDFFYYDETGARHCCDAAGLYRPCFPSPASQRGIGE